MEALISFSLMPTWRRIKKAALVLVALGDLLIVDDKDGSQQEEEPQEDPQEQEPAVHGVELLGIVLLAGEAHAAVPLAQLEHKPLRLGQLFLIILPRQIHLNPELPGAAGGIQVHERLRRLPVRHHQEQLRLFVAQQDGGGVTDGVSNLALDVEGVSLQVRGGFDI